MYSLNKDTVYYVFYFMFRYARDTVIAGDPYAGFDRHTGEIAGFHLDGYVPCDCFGLS